VVANKALLKVCLIEQSITIAVFVAGNVSIAIAMLVVIGQPVINNSGGHSLAPRAAKTLTAFVDDEFESTIFGDGETAVKAITVVGAGVSCVA
jgi:hypothetical protein